MVMAPWRRFKIWDQWKSVSRVFGCTFLALGNEAQRLRTSGISEKKVGLKFGDSEFEVLESEYVSTLESSHLFCGMVLQAYCGLIEEHARDVLRELEKIGVDVSSLIDAKHPTFEEKIDHFPPPNGIEDWGTKILTLVDRSWDDVGPGRAKVVEAIVVRNALAHGTPEVTRRMLNRLENIGGSLPGQEGATIRLTCDSVKDYRDQLRSFARVLSDATAEALDAHETSKRNTRKSKYRKRNGK
jgi:hypothetical protein